MNARLLERTSPVTAGWLFVVVFFAWLAFLFIPASRPEARSVPVLKPEPASKLLAVGLPDNPDLAGLPEIFAIWADKADWVNDRALFAYWNPANSDYSYFFEAIRSGGGVRFRAIRKPEEYEQEYSQKNAVSDEHPLRFIGQIHTAMPVNLLNLPQAPLRVKMVGPQQKIPIVVPQEPIEPLKAPVPGDEPVRDGAKPAPGPFPK